MINKSRIFVTFTFVIFAFCIICTRLFSIQIWQHEELNKKVEKTISKTRPEIPCRGMILDKNGAQLAISIKTYNVFADLNMLKDTELLINACRSCNIKIDKNKLKDPDNPSYVVIAENLDITQMNNLKSKKIPGIGFETQYERKYPEGSFASHILGVVGKDGKGLEGVEYSANSYLTGQKSCETFSRDGRGRIIADKIINNDKTEGSNVYLTIDKNLQFIAEQEAQNALQSTKSKKTVVIIQDPNTGEILALAARPNFDCSNFSGSWNNLKNPALSDTFEPGSTFKLVTAAAAIEEKAVSKSEVIWCEGGSYKVYDHIISDHEKKGFLTFSQILEYSSNIGTTKIAERLGKAKLFNYIRQFGFGSKSGIDLPGEAKGLLRTPDKWSGLSLPTISFGQGIGVSALQIINAYSTIANGGYLLQPKIIKEVRNNEGEVVYSSEKKVIRRVVSSSTASQLNKILSNIIEKGTGQQAKIQGYSICGKTGTAQKRDPVTNKYSASKYVASFCGFLPASDPKITIMVILDEPKGDYYASSTAAPSFQRVAEKAISYLRIQPDENQAICLAAKTKNEK